ncbi:GcvT family protein [Thalassobaculum litoreum]|uniref:Dimethylglycine dehydrogenase n=1 Tax=Thalassobaculum litoreum DSM 18839 TaxID=1123362 RepID=A0A8G2EYV5_9PROT|nr:FAD-dependent oxidoreductase [Thalassobaculum litoreum]SDF97264.1 dimethylglycine dehydrogenase [Thalassobaculum litoreum DSM 18839]
MKSQYRAVIIGGGVVGASVLYHLTKFGWTDIALIERAELTAGSTWHAAAGFHPLNADPNIAALQAYTIKLYKEIEEESGQAVGVHMTGGVSIASKPERWEWLKSAWAVFQTMGVEEARLLTPEEIRELNPIADLSDVIGGLYDPHEGHLDPYGTTHAYAGAAKKRGADVILRNRVIELKPRAEGGWDVVTEQGTIIAEHVVNAAGLWAKQVGLMAGVDLPVTPMEHHYLVTEPIPELEGREREMCMLTDLEGFTYSRQERGGLLVGVYELTPKHWNIEGAPWDYGIELIPEDIDRIAPELAKGFERYPLLNDTGIRKWVNGAFTFAPDGNPLVGPVPGVPNYWLACGVMAGFSQGGGVGKSLAEWMIHGEPEADVFGMDIARFGKWASNREYLRQTTGQFYSRRFVMAYPNEQLPAGRPLRVSPSHDAHVAANARFGVSWGLEVPLFFAPSKGFEETPTLKRSNAFDIVAAETRAVREGVGLLDTSGYSRYEVSGPGAAKWLDRMLACRLPAVGRARLAPMLSPTGRLMGDLTVFNWDGETFWLMGSYYLRQWHMRWFDSHTAADVSVRDISDAWTGWLVSGPNARALMQRAVVNDSVAADDFRFMACREMDIGLTRARVGRLSVLGELGYEINVPAPEHRMLRDALVSAGQGLGLAPVGGYAANAMRLEKSYGVWSTEFTQAYTPGMTGLDRWIAFDKSGFVGREAALREKEAGTPAQRLVTLAVDADGADARGFEPVWIDGKRIGFVTSGGYGHSVGMSLAMALVDSEVAVEGTAVDVHVVGEKRPARIIADSPYDPSGARLRG